ncbi:Transposase IS116/IS110/IS902 family protein [Arthrobacter sp. cf158]|uniref:IS110 family transposase n=1 Tax=Arthrobacter sp. cf158 TaxID=1761744 RepID=UPI000898054A|nr:transposase [Arthrobacter sp. cf158]SDW90467.1 Transposase IS116/IS110/IS902 family protein [Arthrobacter sp. cf158]
MPGLTLRKAADLPQKSKTDARDAFIIAATARGPPHTLRAVDRDSEVLAAPKVLSGFDADPTYECTKAVNRPWSLLLQLSPPRNATSRGQPMTRSLIVEPFIKYAGPTDLRAAGRSNVLRKDPVSLVDATFTALGEQTVTVNGTEAAELVSARVAGQIKELKHQPAIVAKEVEKLLDAFPLSQDLMCMPGVCIKTRATILLTIGDAGTFTPPGHLAAYAAIEPGTRRSGPSNAVNSQHVVQQVHKPTECFGYCLLRVRGCKCNLRCAGGDQLLRIETGIPTPSLTQGYQVI